MHLKRGPQFSKGRQKPKRRGQVKVLMLYVFGVGNQGVMPEIVSRALLRQGITRRQQGGVSLHQWEAWCVDLGILPQRGCGGSRRQ